MDKKQLRGLLVDQYGPRPLGDFEDDQEEDR